MKDKDVIIALDMHPSESIAFLRKFHKEGLYPFVKIGMELFYDGGINIVGRINKFGHNIFLDLKLHDIPTTVGKATKVLSYLPINILSIHSSGGLEMMKFAKENCGEINLAAVTELTSTRYDVNHLIWQHSLRIGDAGLNYGICPAMYSQLLKDEGLKTICPGIRLEGDPKDDQQWVATPSQAKAAGADYIVVGRSITNAKDPVEAYLQICEEFL